MAKNYKSFTGLTGFHYKAEGTGVAEVERVEYLQEISVSKDQSIEKAYGDNVVAEMAVTNGTAKHNGVDPSPLPIVVAGGGCVGLFLALLLVQSNIPNRVIVSNLPSSIFSALTYVNLQHVGRRTITSRPFVHPCYGPPAPYLSPLRSRRSHA